MAETESRHAREGASHTKRSGIGQSYSSLVVGRSMYQQPTSTCKEIADQLCLAWPVSGHSLDHKIPRFKWPPFQVIYSRRSECQRKNFSAGGGHFSRPYFRFDFHFFGRERERVQPGPVPHNGQGGREQIIKQFHRTLRPTLKPYFLHPSFSPNFETTRRRRKFCTPSDAVQSVISNWCNPKLASQLNLGSKRWAVWLSTHS